MNQTVVIALIYLERVSLAVVGLLACVFDQVGWAIFIGCVLVITMAGTSIKIKSNKEDK